MYINKIPTRAQTKSAKNMLEAIKNGNNDKKKNIVLSNGSSLLFISRIVFFNNWNLKFIFILIFSLCLNKFNVAIYVKLAIIFLYIVLNEINFYV